MYRLLFLHFECYSAVIHVSEKALKDRNMCTYQDRLVLCLHRKVFVVLLH